MWKKVGTGLLLALFIFPGGTWAAYGDVIGNMPTPLPTETRTSIVKPAPAAKPAPAVKSMPAPAAKPAPAVKSTPAPAAKPAPAVKAAGRKRSQKKTSVQPTVYKSVYSIGDHGWKIREAQHKLKLLGYKPDNEDGHFTKDMSKQLKKFQRHAKLKRTGKLDQQTYDALGWAVFDKTGIQKIKAKDILSTASKYKGVPYVFGGTTPRGFDCSGYVQYVFKQRGADLTRTADTQFEEGVSLSRRQLKPGDLVFFSTYEAGASHVGIYAGNHQFWNATSSQGVMLSDMEDGYWRARYYGARRLLATNNH